MYSVEMNKSASWHRRERRYTILGKLKKASFSTSGKQSVFFHGSIVYVCSWSSVLCLLCSKQQRNSNEVGHFAFYFRSKERFIQVKRVCWLLSCLTANLVSPITKWITKALRNKNSWYVYVFMSIAKKYWCERQYSLLVIESLFGYLPSRKKRDKTFGVFRCNTHYKIWCTVEKYIQLHWFHKYTSLISLIT